MYINAEDLHFQILNNQIRESSDRIITLEHCMGQRYIGSGMSGKEITINGVPGNALGAYLDGGKILVCGNAQDATGDTMNDGEIIVRGSCGDATGYGMRGGKIYVRGNVGYRAGIHMKAYQDQQPVLVVGGEAGSFLGEYQAGGTIIVLGLGSNKKTPVGSLCGTGMHGGAIYLRCDELPEDLPEQVAAAPASKGDLAAIDGYLNAFCEHFGVEKPKILSKGFQVLRPNTSNPYKALYTTYL
ncbi:glutamate synthase [Clostridium sp. D33t1_170424_F3]|uniref:GltB/FmdC/FwdC-like GXGXG domain-containing protein n=1 Tax=Clostridium sp. D33t1_170424_F3 TaxID=2787099 RepID=UPI0018A92C65|nr:glutamate synthase [Clostridium sp. D33t1_170424_F3]